MLGWLTPHIHTPFVGRTRDAHAHTHQHRCQSSRDNADSPAPPQDRLSSATVPITTPSWLAEDKALTAAKQAAVRALNRRTMHSSQLRDKLLQRGHPPEAIDAALEVQHWQNN